MLNKKVIGAFLLTTLAINAHAASIDTSFLTTFGCAIYEYLTGPISTWAFIIVVIGALVLGIFSSIDWSKIVTVVAVFAVIQSVASILVENPTAAKHLKTASCLKA